MKEAFPRLDFQLPARIHAHTPQVLTQMGQALCSCVDPGEGSVYKGDEEGQAKQKKLARFKVSWPLPVIFLCLRVWAMFVNGWHVLLTQVMPDLHIHGKKFLNVGADVPTHHSAYTTNPSRPRFPRAP